MIQFLWEFSLKFPVSDLFSSKLIPSEQWLTSRCSWSSSSRGYTRKLWQGAHIPSIYQYQKNFCEHCCQGGSQSIWAWYDLLVLLLHLFIYIYDCFLTEKEEVLGKIWPFLTRHCFIGLATRLPQPHDLVAYAESCMYSPSYRSYRWLQKNLHCGVGEHDVVFVL